MDAQFLVVFSNRIEELYDRFKKAAFSSPPFAKRLVIVPSPAMKTWLMLCLAKDPDVGIAAGLEISYLDQSIQRIQELLSPYLPAVRLPNAMELALTIEWELKHILTTELNPLWTLLRTYLHLQPDLPLSRKSERRLIALAEKLASLFLEYSKYGGEALVEWESKPSDHWQKELWNRVFQNGQTYLYRNLQSIFPIHAVPHLSIHLFSMSYLSKVHYDFFSKLSSSTAVYHYLLSPCQLFWSDLRSEKETTRILHQLKNQGVSLTKQNELEAYMKDCNPLLANFGKLGREMARQIEEQASTTEEYYHLPKGTTTLLKAIQADMLLLRNPAANQKTILESNDKTIQVHAAPTHLREVQAIYDLLLNIIDRHAASEDPIKPSDILVMAPDIIEYAPYIKMTFVQEDSLLDAQIMDLHLTSQSPLIQGFLHLLSLPFGRWDSISLLQLFHYQPFYVKQQFESEDLNIIETWIKECGISWGHNSQHRDELLSRAHCSGGMIDPSAAGTWEFGMERLLAGLVFDAAPCANIPLAPYEEIDFSKSELLGRVLSLLRSLHEELRPLADGTSLTLTEWSGYLRHLLEKYFEGPHEDLIGHLEAFSKAAQILPSASYSFLSIKKHLESALSKQTTAYREFHLSAVRFCSLLPMRTIPAKVIVWMGLHEGAFPRQDQKLSLNLLLGNPKADFRPSQTDFDRYLFLESLLSARDYFIMSYLNYSSQDSKEQPPSLLITELMNYIESAYEIPGGFFSFKHSFNVFDKSYFAQDNSFPGYSQEHFRQACAFYCGKEAVAPFVPQFVAADQLNDPLTLDLKDLSSFASNPLKVYFNRTLGIYLENSEDNRMCVDEKFVLDNLERDALKKSALKLPVKEIIDDYEKRGHFPLGLFKSLAIEKIMDDVQDLKENLFKGGVHPETLFEIEFSHQYALPKCTEKGKWGVPPLEVNYKGKKLTITGKFHEVSNAGLILHRNADKTDIVKVYPQVVIFHMLVNQYALPFQTRYIFAKDGKVCTAFAEDSSLLLERFLDYYFFGIKNASPLLPEWVPYLFSADHTNVKEKLSPQKTPYNDYALWILRKGSFPNIENSLQEWKTLAKSLYGDFYEKWI